MNLTRVTPPAAFPVSLSEVKRFCRIEDTDNDTIVTAFLKSAVELAENVTGRRFISQQWRLSLDKFRDEIILPYPSLLSVDSVQYYDEARVLQLLDSGVYEVDAVDGIGRVTLALDQSWPQSYPHLNSVLIDFTCGYANADSVPNSLRDAISTIVWFMFDGRGSQLDSKMLNFMLGPHIMRGFDEPS